MEIVENIKNVARANGVQIYEIAEKMKITRSSLWSRLRDPKLSTLQAVADAIGVPVSAFFTEESFTSSGLTCPHCGASLRVFVK